MQYTQEQLSELVKSVEKEFTAHLAKAEGGGEAAAPLAKSETASEPVAAQTEGAVETPVAQAAAVEAQPLQKNEEHKPEEDCDYDEEDKNQVHQMYKSMSKGELKVHSESIAKALESGDLQKSGEQTMSKSENEVKPVETAPVQAQPNAEIELLKSEAEAAKAKADGLQKNLDAVTAFLTKFVEKTTAPAQKAITSIEVIKKSEGGEGEAQPLSKSEVTNKLVKKAADPSLSKSDRDAINSYYLNGASIDTISHLLK